MKARELEGRWEDLAAEVLSGMAEWRVQHPRATMREIEDAVDERLDRMRTRLLADAAMASEAADWREAPPEERPRCPECREPLQARSRQTRRLQSQGRGEVVLERSQGTCPSCGASLFPPG
jgi:RNase P subunit RPR2